MARYALVVGTAQYDNFRKLDKAATDAAAISRILQLHGQYQVEPLPKRLVEAENCWELATDKKLTGKDLGQALEMFLLEQANGHEALLYFAGHGFEVPGLGSKKKGYLATSNCASDGRNAILFSDLNDLIRESSLSSLVVILDCCHAGSFLERTLLESTLTAFKEKKDYYLITACRSFERAREGEEHGVFTASVLKGLRVENADSEGVVTGDRLFDFIQRELRQSGQEPIRTGTGRSIRLVTYQPQVKAVTAIMDDRGEVICPYQGLQAFTAAQREFFFGRKRVVEAIKQKLEQQPFVPVIGSSGSGKSSVVRAGLMPWLSESGWRILEPIKPGFEPLAALRAVFEPFFKRSRSDIQTLHLLITRDSPGLPGVIERLQGDDKYLLVVDQFEEVFTVCADETERQRFIEIITQVAEIQNSRLAVVTTMRADFLDPCLHYPSMHHLIQSQAVFMPPLRGVNLRDAITEPAKRQGYTLEESLLLQILEDVREEPGFLPLLEFALTKLWEKRDCSNYLLTLEQYEKLEGLTGALNLYAERVYHYRDYEAEFPCNKRNEQEQRWIKQIFLRLVRTGEGEKDTRQRQTKAKIMEIVGNNSNEQEAFRELLAEGLVQGRLLVVGKEEQDLEAWVDLAHESLMEVWNKFVEWRQEDRDLRRLIDRLEDARREWLKMPRESNLLMGGLLAQVREKWSEIEPELANTTREFYQKSNEYEKEQQKKQDLPSALGFALRSFNDINEFLELVPLIASQVSDTYAGALLLFKPDGQIRLERLHCQNKDSYKSICGELETAVQKVTFPSIFASQEKDKEVVSATIAELNNQINQHLKVDTQFFGAAIVIRNVERGRIYVFSSDSNYVWTEARQKLIRLVADQTAVALDNDEMSVQIRKNQRLERELEIAAEIQLKLLPRECPSIPGVNLAARCRTAQRVGGNYYDFIHAQSTLDNSELNSIGGVGSWGIVIGQVMSKGMSAGLIMTMLRGVLQTAKLDEYSPSKILQRVNQVMYDDLKSSNRFVTLFYSEYDPQTRLLSFSNAAHNPPLLWQSSTQSIKRLDTIGMLIGLDPQNDYGEGKTQLYPGDWLIYYTDGFTDAANQYGRRFDEENLIKAFQLACQSYKNPLEILNYLFHAVDRFIGTANRSRNDMTLIVMQLE